ncbi:hypothetical protein BJY52DRAFT_1222851 [Lactarius psammicola]|nr:hypothetical protein BJY52DRAFT_1222851 [Lactarius psammicola]
MSSRPPRKYDAAVKALLRLRSDFAVLADNPKTVEEWVNEFSTCLETVFASGVHIGVHAGEDAQVAAFLRNVRARLLPHTTEVWLEHSPRVVAGMEEELRQRATAPSAVPVLDLIVAPAAPRPSPAPLQDDFALLLEYSQWVKAGTMSEAEFEVHKVGVLTAGQRPHSSVSPAVSVAPPPSSLAPSPSALGAVAASFPAVSPSLSVVPLPSSQAPSPFQPPAPSPAASRTSAPSPLLFSTVAPSLPVITNVSVSCAPFATPQLSLLRLLSSPLRRADSVSNVRARTSAARKGKGKARVNVMEEDEEVAESSGPADAAESVEGPGEA